MNYTIENSELKVTISDRGAEMLSVISQKSGTEYIWQGDEKYWTGHAPLMFPICGRLTDGKYTYEGKEYELVRHGFLRESILSAKQNGEDEITFSLRNDENTYKSYPFEFIYETTFKLDGKSLIQTFKVTNPAEKELVFGLGAHPAFNVPLEKGLSFEDYYIEFPEKDHIERFVFSDAALMTEDIENIELSKGGRLMLKHELFDNDAIFMRNNPNCVKLASDRSKVSLTVSYENLPYLGLWHATKTDAPYICIEPWSALPAYDGIVDDMKTKRHMTHLESGKTATFSMTVSIEE